MGLTSSSTQLDASVADMSICIVKQTEAVLSDMLMLLKIWFGIEKLNCVMVKVISSNLTLDAQVR